MSGGGAETGTKEAQRNRKEAEQKKSQTSEGSAVRAVSRSSGGMDDGLADVVVAGKRRSTQQDSPSPQASPVTKTRLQNKKGGMKSSALSSSSEDDELNASGVIEA